MNDSSQSLKSIFAQALLAAAAYADLAGVAYAADQDNAQYLGALTQVMPIAAAKYVAMNFGVVQHQPNTLSGFSVHRGEKTGPHSLYILTMR